MHESKAEREQFEIRNKHSFTNTFKFEICDQLGKMKLILRLTSEDPANSLIR